MHKNKTTIIFGLSIFIALLAIAVLIFFFRIIKNKNQHTSAVLTTLESKITKKADISTLKKKISELEDARADLDSYFVNSSRIDSFINYLEKLGAGTGASLEVKSVEVSTKEENTIIGEISISGSFVDVMQAMILVENIPYKIHVTSIYLNKNTQADSTEVTSKEKGKEKIIKTPTWQADISFKILSLS